jgi:hypothetical protein
MTSMTDSQMALTRRSVNFMRVRANVRRYAAA